MSSVRFTRSASIVADARAERTWNAPNVGQAGSATISIPRSSPAANPAYINPDGASLVEILDEGGCGNWVGACLSPEFTSDGQVVIPAVQTWGILTQRTITRSGALIHASPGLVVSEALNASTGGVATIHLGASHDGDSPDIAESDLDGQDAWSVLTEVMQTANSDLYVDETGGVFHCGQAAFATRHDTLLVAGGNLYNPEVRTESYERVQEVIATSGDQSYTASRTDADMTAWPAQAAISVDAAGDVMVVAAHAELAQRNSPTIVIEGSVGPDLWHIRERDFIKVLVPWAGFTGRSRWCRVLSRQLSDDSLLMRLQLQVMQPMAGSIQTPGSPARQKPPQRPGRDRKHGSFVQRMRSNQWAVALLERRG